MLLSQIQDGVAGRLPIVAAYAQAFKGGMTARIRPSGVLPLPSYFKESRYRYQSRSARRQLPTQLFQEIQRPDFYTSVTQADCAISRKDVELFA